MTPEQREIRSVGMRRVWAEGRRSRTATPEARAKQSVGERRAWASGRRTREVSIEQRVKISQTLTGRVQSAETIAKRVEKLRGKPRGIDTREKIASSLRGRSHSAERRANQSASRRAVLRGDRGVGVQERSFAGSIKGAWNARRVQSGATSTFIERAVVAVLDLLGERYEAQKRIGRYAVDFYLPDRHLVVECDGEYWHRDKARDELRDANLREAGYHQIVHIPGKAIVKDARAALEAAWRL